VLEFIEDGVKRNNMQIAQVENVLKAELVVEFEAAWEEMKRKRGVDLARPQIVCFNFLCSCYLFCCFCFCKSLS
jgi:hypothetical protein